MRLFLVEDHPTMLEGLRLALADLGLDVCGNAATAAEAEAGIAATVPDSVVVDLSLEEGSGLELVARLCGSPRPAVVVYSMHESPARIRDALQAGAGGYVTKREPATVLAEALDAIQRGETFLSPRAAEALGEQEAAGEDARQALSPREAATYRALGEGLGTDAIAQRLGISPRTVESYCARVQVKLRLRGMNALRQDAIAHRLP